MKFNYQLSKLAIRDLDSIWIYTSEQWSKKQANTYFQQLIKTIELNCKNPEIGKSLKEVKEDHRSYLTNRHMIIYKIEKDIVYIDRILHQSMDIEDKLMD